MVDATGARITTDPANALDNYSVEMDVEVPATAATGTFTASFDVKNGNGVFLVDESTDALFSGAPVGDAIAVNAVRVKDSTGAVIGRAGVAAGQ